MSTYIGKQAIIIGAGMGGLSAARAVADYFEQVMVLERDALPADPIHRVGTPQAQHVHVLLTSGLNALRALFPKFEQDLIRAGAVPLRHAYPHSSGIIAWYMSANKELGHDASDAGRSVA